MNIDLKILDKRLYEECSLTYATAGSVGLDLIAAETWTFYPNEIKLIPTGIAIHIKDEKVGGFIYPRSGLSVNHGLVLANGVGVVDSDYIGQILVPLLYKTGMVRTNSSYYTVKRGERIAQLVFQPVVKPTFSLVEEFIDYTSRGDKGFGHSGV